ncbi:hypothetical protein HHK36_008600 [Tetracentron sinense]|uniref:1-acylglycerol-3-phosphate O-acyltransferase n=1 Tax=Tetracentron sinense TaxID=13715 RepID=A0A834ZGM7_TETSI|nr:hypothetical protein HHK36_008600 [Tetracentron sinense]
MEELAGEDDRRRDALREEGRANSWSGMAELLLQWGLILLAGELNRNVGEDASGEELGVGSRREKYVGRRRFCWPDRECCGGSSRPDFTCKSTEETEDWFINSFEEWRKAKDLSNFILLGHSLGGYFAAKYALKHPEHIKHLILVGPAGFSSETDGKSEWLTKFRATWKGAILNHLWESNFTPQKLVRGLGPWGPNLVQRYTSARFGSYSTGNILTEEESRLLTDYFYHTLAAKSSGELCLNYIFSFGAFTRMPLLHSASEWKVPTTFIYGNQDWMNYQGAQEARKHMKVPCEIIRVPQVSLSLSHMVGCITSARPCNPSFNDFHLDFHSNIEFIGGHFVFIENPGKFHSAVMYACRRFLSPDFNNQSLPEGLTSA